MRSCIDTGQSPSDISIGTVSRIFLEFVIKK
jgi:hypothetical protein